MNKKIKQTLHGQKKPTFTSTSVDFVARCISCSDYVQWCNLEHTELSQVWELPFFADGDSCSPRLLFRFKGRHISPSPDFVLHGLNKLRLLTVRSYHQIVLRLHLHISSVFHLRVAKICHLFSP